MDTVDPTNADRFGPELWRSRRELPDTAGHRAATRAATETILNCYMREGGAWRPMAAADVPRLAEEGDEFVAVIPFPEQRAAVLAGVRHLSPTHRHRFRTPVKIAMAGGEPLAVTLETLMSLLADELGDTKLGEDPTAPGSRGPDPTFLLARIRQSVRCVGDFLEARAGEVERLWGADPLSFIASEQAGLLGHMAHPTAKSRWELDAGAVAAYAPEAGARFALRWLAVDPALVEHDSAAGAGAPQLLEETLRADPAVDAAALDERLAGLGERVLVPVHPWELEHLRAREPLAALLADGRVVELGALGGEVAPTAALRTVYRAEWPWQLRLGMHVRIGDGTGVEALAELRRGVGEARLLDGAAAAAAAAQAERLTILRDPAYLAVHVDGVPVEGLSVVLRENRWPAGSAADVSALEMLLQDHPFGGDSRLARIVARLAERLGRDPGDVACEWFARYAQVALVPLLRLCAQAAIELRSDQRDTLLELADGWPQRCVLRDARAAPARAGSAGAGGPETGGPEIGGRESGGRESGGTEAGGAGAGPRAGAGIGEGPFLDNALAVINALGVAGCIEEIELLAQLKALLEAERERGGADAALLGRLLEDPAWPVRAHLRTRLHDAPEPLEVRVANPLHGVR